mgnify:CR=1 FL=1
MASSWSEWGTRILLGAVALVVLATAAVWALSERELRADYGVTVDPVEVPSDSASLARGRHLARSVLVCTDCHGADLGGAVAVESRPVAVFVGPNLTSGEGSVIRDYSVRDWVRAIRHGIGPDGDPLLLMPSSDYYWLGERDLGALIAYLESLDPVDRDPGSTRLGPLGRLFLAVGRLPVREAEEIPHDREPAAAPEPAPTRAYGMYLSRVAGCVGCHGSDLRGGPIPGAPPEIPAAPDITSRALQGWSRDGFARALREGVRPDSTPISPFMPWEQYGGLTATEIDALWAFLQAT